MRVSGSLKGANIYLDFPSVGATENLLMAASLAKGVPRIENAAKEPEIADLCRFLTAMGARVAGAGTANLTVEGVESLHGAEYTPIPDRIEAGTLVCAAALTEGSVLLENARSDHMRALLFKLAESGLICQEDARGLRLRGRAKHPPGGANPVLSGLSHRSAGAADDRGLPNPRPVGVPGNHL